MATLRDMRKRQEESRRRDGLFAQLLSVLNVLYAQLFQSPRPVLPAL